VTQPDAIESLASALIADLTAVVDQLEAAIRDAMPGWFHLTPPARVIRLRELQTTLLAMINDADAIAANRVVATMQTAYETGAWAAAIGAGATAGFSGIDVDAVTHLATDTMSNLLQATKGMREDVKQVIRELTRDQVRTKLYVGQTAIQAGQDLAKTMADRGITAVVYSNGAHVSLAQYAEMVIRTKTAEAYQEGGLNQGEQLGIDWWEVMDGPGCGWTSHDDPQKADGMIVPLASARAHPLSHPNCRRSTTPRPDIASLSDAQDATPTPTTSTTRVWDAAVRAQAQANRAVATSTTPARASAGLDTAAGVIPNTPAGRRFAATLAKHTA